MEPISVCHVVAVPYPGRGHINPMISLCCQLAARKPNMIITIVVTEEWAGLIGQDTRPGSIRLVTVPNVVPSERDRARDMAGFLKAIMTELREAVEDVLDRLEPPLSCIVADCALSWAVTVANRRNIPLASLWTASASFFSILYHFDLVRENGHSPTNVTERGEEVIDYVPGVSPTRLADLPLLLFEKCSEKVLQELLLMASEATKAQYILINSVHELEPEAFNVLKARLPLPIYSICAPSIPHYLYTSDVVPEYLQWLDSQPKRSVLYVSFGSFLSVSGEEIEEIVAGVSSSGVRYLWVMRDGNVSINMSKNNNDNFVVPWCDQLRVLCHPSVGGFLTHCGWNSILEGVYAGVSMLTFPIIWDQIPNSKNVVVDWKIGYRVTKKERSEIAGLVRSLMHLGNHSMRKRAEELREVCRGAVVKGGSSDANLDAFITNISRHN